MKTNSKLKSFLSIIAVVLIAFSVEDKPGTPEHLLKVIPAAILLIISAMLLLSDIKKNKKNKD